MIKLKIFGWKLSKSLFIFLFKIVILLSTTSSSSKAPSSSIWSNYFRVIILIFLLFSIIWAILLFFFLIIKTIFVRETFLRIIWIVWILQFLRIKLSFLIIVSLWFIIRRLLFISKIIARTIPISFVSVILPLLKISISASSKRLWIISTSSTSLISPSSSSITSSSSVCLWSWLQCRISYLIKKVVFIIFGFLFGLFFHFSAI